MGGILMVAESMDLFFLDKSVLDKALPKMHKAVLAALLKHENKMYPGALAKAVIEETGDIVSVPAVVKIIKSLTDKELVKEVPLDGFEKPHNISGYYSLTRKGLFLATFWAKENGVSESKIQDTIKRCLLEYNYPQEIIDKIIDLRMDIASLNKQNVAECIPA